ncbi:MAG TPA: aminopeptidase P N-terminal domain-containing protein [Acidimicrobiia bacterium]|nr:aminopeptidase P N-terminal domain-containing protein [Acidimicrobiia bacterium]
MADRYVDHRRRLAETVGADGIAVIPASAETVRNDDVHHEFRQDSNFAYLTGFEEPDAVAVIAPGHPDGDYTLFVRPRDPEMEAWTGYRVGVEGARERYGADAAYEIDRLDEVLPKMMLGRSALWYRMGNPGHDARITALLDKARSYRDRYGRPAPEAVLDVSRPLGEARLIKSPEELESIRAACLLSAEGHREAMRFARPGVYEYQVQAAMEYVWREGGSPRNGYPSIVASGPNACILHYIENDREMEDGDLLLIDAAAEVDYYSSDITRTFPVNGSFTGPQRALYDVVLSAQRAAIAEISPGGRWHSMHDTAVRVLTEGLVDLGLLPRGVDDSLAMHHYRQYYFHGTGHWLGLDVHDRGTYRVDGQSRQLEPGMLFTVEPGLYFDISKAKRSFALLEYDLDEWTEERILEGTAARKRQEQALEEAEQVEFEVPEEFVGLGIRIEDDILVVEGGHENLTSHVPVDPGEVEALCREQSWLLRR